MKLMNQSDQSERSKVSSWKPAFDFVTFSLIFDKLCFLSLQTEIKDKDGQNDRPENHVWKSKFRVKSKVDGPLVSTEQPNRLKLSQTTKTKLDGLRNWTVMKSKSWRPSYRRLNASNIVYDKIFSYRTLSCDRPLSSLLTVQFDLARCLNDARTIEIYLSTESIVSK